MKYTDKYGYRLPEPENPADVRDLTDNWEQLDTQLSEMEQAVAGQETELARHRAGIPVEHADGSVTDAKIGERRVNNVQGPLQELLDLVGDSIAEVKGEQAWNEAPATTLRDAAGDIVAARNEALEAAEAAREAQQQAADVVDIAQSAGAMAQYALETAQNNGVRACKVGRFGGLTGEQWYKVADIETDMAESYSYMLYLKAILQYTALRVEDTALSADVEVYVRTTTDGEFVPDRTMVRISGDTGLKDLGVEFALGYDQKTLPTTVSLWVKLTMQWTQILFQQQAMRNLEAAQGAQFALYSTSEPVMQPEFAHALRVEWHEAGSGDVDTAHEALAAAEARVDELEAALEKKVDLPEDIEWLKPVLEPGVTLQHGGFYRRDGIVYVEMILKKSSPFTHSGYLCNLPAGYWPETNLYTVIAITQDGSSNRSLAQCGISNSTGGIFPLSTTTTSVTSSTVAHVCVSFKAAK